jgi:hypothetical protein
LNLPESLSVTVPDEIGSPAANALEAATSTVAIASTLTIAPRTAAAHVENIRRKLDVRSRAQIAAWVTEHDPRMAAR